MNNQGFSPLISRYLNSVKKSKRQEVVNQIANLQPQDLQQLELQLQQKYAQESGQDLSQQMTMDTGEATYQMGGDLRRNNSTNVNYNKQPMEWFDVPQNITNRFQSVKENPLYVFDPNQNQYLLRNLQGQYRLANKEMLKFQTGGMYNLDDNSPEFLQGYNQNPQGLEQPVISNYGVAMTPEMQAVLQQDPRVNNGSIPASNVPNYVMQNPQGIQGVQVASNPYNGSITHDDLVSSNNVPVAPIPPTVTTKQLNKQDNTNIKSAKQVLEESNAIKSIQQKLKEKLGANLGNTGDNKDGIDGVFGSKTKQAIIEFQKKVGLVPDGIVGSKTKMALGLFDTGFKSYKSNEDKVIQKANKIGIPVVVAKTPQEQKQEIKNIITPSIKNTNSFVQPEWSVNDTITNNINSDVQNIKPVLKFKNDSINRESTRVDGTNLLPIKKRDSDNYVKVGENTLGLEYVYDPTTKRFLDRDKVTGKYREIYDTNLKEKLKKALK